MRPRHDDRQRLLAAALDVTVYRAQGECVGASFRALAQRSDVAIGKAQKTIESMVAAGELAVVGRQREPGVCRPVNLYAAVPRGGADAPAVADLGALLRNWVSAT